MCCHCHDHVLAAIAGLPVGAFLPGYFLERADSGVRQTPEARGADGTHALSLHSHAGMAIAILPELGKLHAQEMTFRAVVSLSTAAG
jgi:hypothetical protein